MHSHIQNLNLNPPKPASMFKNVFLFCIAILFSVSALAQTYAHYSMERLITSWPEYQKATAELQDFVKRMQTEAETERQQMMARAEKLQQERQNSTDVAQETRILNEMRKIENDLYQLDGKYQEKINARSRKADSTFQEKLNTAITRVQQKYGYTYIANSDGDLLFYQLPRYDVTMTIAGELSPDEGFSQPGFKSSSPQKVAHFSYSGLLESWTYFKSYRKQTQNKLDSLNFEMEQLQTSYEDDAMKIRDEYGLSAEEQQQKMNKLLSRVRVEMQRVQAQAQDIEADFNARIQQMLIEAVQQAAWDNNFEFAFNSDSEQFHKIGETTDINSAVANLLND